MLKILDKVIDVFFAFDILLNFRTTFINPKTNLEVLDPKKISLNYVKSVRFWVDLLASIPFEMFIQIGKSSINEQNILESDSQLQIFGLLKLVRLLRLGRIITYMKVNVQMKVGFKLF